MKRIQLMSEYEMILSETILLQDLLAIEHINHSMDLTANSVNECRCRRLCGRKTCDQAAQRNSNESESNNLP